MIQALAMLVPAVSLCLADPPAPAAPKPDQPAPQSDLVAWAAEVRPEIETIAGAKFTANVPIKVVSADELAQLLAAPVERDMAGSKRASGAPMTPIEIHIHATAAAYKVATRTFGLYHYPDKTIYLVPETAQTYAKRHAWGADTTDRVPRLAVAHELVHALQDQKSMLGEHLPRAEGEARAALVSVTEGHAVWVTDQIAAKHGWDVANAMLWGLMTGVQDAEDPKTKGTAAEPVLSAAPSAELYTLGKAFVKFQAEKAGGGADQNAAERLWAIIAKPPQDMRYIRNPETFRALVGDIPDAPVPLAPKTSPVEVSPPRPAKP